MSFCTICQSCFWDSECFQTVSILTTCIILLNIFTYFYICIQKWLLVSKTCPLCKCTITLSKVLELPNELFDSVHSELPKEIIDVYDHANFIFKEIVRNYKHRIRIFQIKFNKKKRNSII